MKLDRPESNETRGNSTVKTAKPLFIGSIPIAASNYLSQHHKLQPN